MSEQPVPYNVTRPVNGVAIVDDDITPTLDELKLLRRLRQAAGQGRLVVVDPDAMAWYLCGPMERTGRRIIHAT